MNFLTIVYFCAVLISGNCRSLPTPTTLLSWLLNVTSSEIQTIATNFNFHFVSPSDIKFLLHIHTPGTPLQNKTREITPYDLDPSKPTKIIVPGWQADVNAEFPVNMAHSYLKKGNFNVIVVDWTKHSKRNYLHASGSTEHVGNAIGDFVLTSTGNNSIFLENMHLVGHSLGAHIMGFAGKRIAKRSGGRVGRITGLDAAGPLFEYPMKMPRLDKNDADFVDGIHTNIGLLGVTEAFGTANFYVEAGGPLQPGCFNFWDPFDSFFCSHSKAHEYFGETILNTKKFEAVSCDSRVKYRLLQCNRNKKALMGEEISKSTKGIFYLESTSALPSKPPVMLRNQQSLF